MRILHVIRSLDPAGGGPAEGIRQFARAHARRGSTVEVATLDAPGAPWLAEFPAVTHPLGPARMKYGYAPGLAVWLARQAPRFDAVIVNGLWQYHGFAAWRALRGSAVPYFVFTHGMLDPWFRRRYPLKHFKKWLYWPWAEYRVLRDARAVLFTCEEEERRAPASFWLYRARGRVVGYGIDPPEGDAQAQRRAFLSAFPALEGRRLLLFLGRIHPKKGLDLLLEAFARAGKGRHLVVAGPGEARWIAAMRELARRLGIAERVTWTGMLSGAQKWGALRAAEAFVLPSHQENFGIAVVEAMACGTPVLISREVNIWREIEADGAGMAVADDAAGTRSLLERWAALGDDERAAMAERAQAAFRDRFHIDAATARLVEVISRG